MLRHILAVFFICLITVTHKDTQAATVLTFDDIGPISGTSSSAAVPDGYGGLNWGNTKYLNATTIGQYYVNPENGYHNGLVSGEHVAFNPASRMATISGDRFNFIGAFFTAAWHNGLSIDIKGYDGLNLIHDTTITVDTDAPTWFEFNWAGVTKLELSSYGGLQNPTYTGSGTHFGMDDFTFSSPVPLPAALWLFGSGLLGLIGFSRRKMAA